MAVYSPETGNAGGAELGGMVTGLFGSLSLRYLHAGVGQEATGSMNLEPAGRSVLQVWSRQWSPWRRQ